MMTKKNNAIVLPKFQRRILLAFILVIAVIRLVYLFDMRDGHHVDETWSYIHANSYYDLDIYTGGGDSSKKLSDLVKSEVFRNYITVSEDHRFSFDAVLHNTEYDMSPPLYPLFLHFICSFFPNSFSWWYAFSISLIAYVPTLILIYLIIYKFTDSYFCSFIGLVYYIFSGCGTADFLYLRVYHLFTLFALALFYFFILFIKENGNKKIVLYLLIPLFTLLGIYNHYYFLILAFAYTLFSAFLLLFKKRFKDAIMLGTVMLLSVIVFFIAYKPALNQLIPIICGNVTATGYYDYPYRFDLINANIRFFMDTIGFYINFNVPGLIFFVGILTLISIIVFLIIYVFRNEKWMKSFLKKTIGFLKLSLSELISFLKKFDSSIYVGFLTCIFYLIIIPITAPLTNMGFIERYFFPAMSLFIAVYMSFAGMLIKSLILNSKSLKTVNKSKVVIAVLLLGIIVAQNYRSNYLVGDFRFLNMKEEELSLKLANKDVYAIVYSERDLIWLCPVLLKSNNVYINYHEDLFQETDIIPNINSNCMVLLLETGLITEEQKEELLENDTFSFTGLMKPKYLYTAGDVIDAISKDSGIHFGYVDNYPTFIGNIGLYEQDIMGEN